MSSIDQRLEELGITLPDAAAPAANYVPTVVSGNYVYVSGQIPMEGGQIKFTGKAGADVSTEVAADAARLCGLNIIAQLKAACGGDLDRVKRIVKLVGFVNSTPDYTDQPEVINGASNLMVDVFGDKGRHARSAVSAGSLPRGVTVEVEAIAEIG